MANNIRFFMFSAIFSVGTAAGHPGYWWKRHVDNTEYADRKNPPVYSEHGADAQNSNRENFFQEIYMLQSAPKQIEFGHVCENPHEWEQRYEKKDFDRNRHQGKVRWADKRGNHGEHYWDYNHAGPSSVQEVSMFECSGGDIQCHKHLDVGDVKGIAISRKKGGSSTICFQGFYSLAKSPPPSTTTDRHPCGITFALFSEKQDSNQDKEHKQHQKRQLNTEVKEVEAKEDTPLSEEAQEFLESFHREIEGVFNLRFNKNLFSEQGSDSFKHLTNNIRFFLPQIKDELRKSKRSP